MLTQMINTSQIFLYASLFLHFFWLLRKYMKMDENMRKFSSLYLAMEDKNAGTNQKPDQSGSFVYLFAV